MQRDFNNDDFESFLKQKVDQYKIYPSDGVWKGVYNALHARKRWIMIGGFLFITGSLLISRNMISKQNRHELQPVHSSASDYRRTNTPAAGTIVFQPLGTVTTTQAGKITGAPKNETRLQSVPVKALAALAEVPIITAVPALVPTVTYNENTDVPANMLQQPAEEQRHMDALVAAQLNETSNVADNAVKQPDKNWLQERATISLGTKRESSFKLQLYFSPTISYRRLADNKSNTNNNQVMPLMSVPVNIDRYVDHTPAIGAELGANVLFIAGNNLTLKTGLQLNYTRYTIMAYKFYNEKASIALNSLGHTPDTLTSYTSLRNFDGYSPEMLQNQYLQISMPVGAEVKLLGSKRLQLNVAGTVQPTYLLLSNTYLLSTDYVNYAKEPSLIRKWNVHTSVEAFVSYKTGGIRWQLGPQFRYQLMSSYNDRYPIKEYLMEYGIKFGLSKTLR